MDWLRVGYRFPGLVLVQCLALLAGGVLALGLAGQRRRRAIARCTGLWGRACCGVLNIRMRVKGALPGPGPLLVVSNHVGVPDIFILAACFDAFFVSRFDVERWPLVGAMTRLGGTIYIDRSRRHRVGPMVQAIQDRLEEGFRVALFPEGGATDGATVQPFKTPAFEAAVRSGVTVQPVALRYHDGQRPSVACWRDVPFLTYFLNLMRCPRLEATVEILPRMEGDDRQELARRSHDAILRAYQAPGG